MFETMTRDFGIALRSFRKSPGFTAIALITLTLGIGANTAIFSVVNAALIRSLPFEQPESLVLLQGNVQRARVERRGASYPDFLDWRAQSRLTEGMAGYLGVDLTIDGPEPERVTAEAASARYFPLLAIRPLLGRTFAEDEDLRGAGRVAILSHGYWQRRFGGDPATVGRPITIDGAPFTVIGVLPASFRGLTDRAELWVNFPGVASGLLTNRGTRGFPVLARLKPGVSIEQAQAEVTEINRGLARAYPDTNDKRSAEVVWLTTELMGAVRPALFAVLGAVAFVLLIACANVASLLLGRAEARQREMALRTALGASRGRLRTQMMVEGLVLTGAAGGLGLLAAPWAADALLRFSPVTFPGFVRAEIDPTVLAFTLGVSLISGLLLGFAPLWQIDVSRLAETLKEDARGSVGKGRLRLRQSIVVAEVALALMLLVGAGLFMRSLSALLAVDPGFETERLLTMSVSLPAVAAPASAAGGTGSGASRAPGASGGGSASSGSAGPGRPATAGPAAGAAARAGVAGAGAAMPATSGTGGTAAAIATATTSAARANAEAGSAVLEVVRRIGTLPGVERVSAGSDIPLSGGGGAIFYSVEGQPSTDAQSIPRAYRHRVLPGFFATLGLDLVSGRDFTVADRRAESTPVIVSEAVAHRFWPGDRAVERALGQRLKAGSPDSDAPWLSIVGVVRESRYRGLPSNPTSDPDLFFPMPAGARGFALLVRARLDADLLTDTVRRELRAAAPAATVSDVRTMEARVGVQMARPRFVTWLMGIFAGVALLLAAIGVYGVMAQSVARRTQEIGIRMALGADARSILGLVLGRGLRLVSIGIVAGAAGALLIAPLLRTLLFGVGAADPLTFLIVSALLTSVALAASAMPAWRALRVDPLVALRRD